MTFDLPPELFYQIALHLPLTSDVLALSLTNSSVHNALSTPALFKARLALQGWDVSAWQNEDDNSAQPLIVLKRWMRIDYIYCKTAQLFEDPVLFSVKNIDDLESGQGWPQLLDPHGGRPDSIRVLDGEKTFSWLRKLSDVFPVFITHHRGGNISRITEARHRDALWAYTRFVATIHTPDNPPPVNPPEYDCFERICFSLIALLMQCEASTVASVFSDAWGGNSEPPLSAFQRAFWIADEVPSDEDEGPSSALIQELWQSIPEQHFVGFFVQSLLCVTLHLEAAVSDMNTPPPLLAPSLRHIESPSCYDQPFELGTTSLPRPWLRDGLAGTPFAGLSTTTATLWAGYYTVVDMAGRDPPMFLELRSVEGPRGTAPERKYFRGEGHDGVGTFMLNGVCDTRTGTVNAMKGYEMHAWEWRGVITPFGMVGTWGGSGWSGGWWWIWPREWSPATDRA